jgi:hypothetical protein
MFVEASTPPVCSRAMARRMLVTALALVARKSDIPMFLRMRSGVAVLELARIDRAAAIEHTKRLANFCEAMPAGNVAEVP